MTGEIIRVAAKGDGITADGRHVAFAAPGDMVRDDGSLEPGPHHATPPCRHFGTCGGCQLQHLDEASLTQFVHDRVVHAAEGQGLAPERIVEPHLSPPNTRRRATLHAINGGGRPLIGFREAGSHRVVDMKENFILAPELIALLAPLRALLTGRKDRYAADIELTLADQGVDCGLKG
ncbi:MAG TPA: class I SAM-dependent RNA methyltransferase, partial [Croceibacterium sp.]|nr:class I SAM-dependent RNA methyltransferase [Croceibacterium sp.]